MAATNKALDKKELFLEETFEKICHDLATSSLGLNKICDTHGISSRSFQKWIREDIELDSRYTRAREEQAEFIADEMIQIADDSSQDTITKDFGGVEVEMENKEFVNRSKLRIETRKWIASKLKRKKFGDHQDITSGDKPISNVVTIFKLPDNDRDKKDE